MNVAMDGYERMKSGWVDISEAGQQNFRMGKPPLPHTRTVASDSLNAHSNLWVTGKMLLHLISRQIRHKFPATPSYSVVTVERTHPRWNGSKNKPIEPGSWKRANEGPQSRLVALEISALSSPILSPRAPHIQSALAEISQLPFPQADWQY